MKMWAVVENDKPLQCLERPDPVPTGRQVLIKVSHCGVCHSDLHFVHGEFDLGGGQKLKITDRGAKLPCAPGHEIVGKVVALGPDADGVKIGDERIVYPWIGCGECDLCQSDNENLCYQPRGLGVIQDGGFSSHVILPNSSYLFAFDGIDPALAATFACSGLTVYSAIRKALPLDKKKPVLVIGAGGVGLAAVAMLRALDHEKIIVADISAEKRQAALQAGVIAVVDNSAPDAAAQIMTAGGGFLQAAFDFVNIGATVGVALETLGKRGKLVLVGVGGGDFRLPLAGLIFRPRLITGTITGNRAELRDVIALAQAGKLKPLDVTRMPKDSANEALDLLKAGKVVGRIVLEEQGR